MLATSPSPNLSPTAFRESPTAHYASSPRPHYERALQSPSTRKRPLSPTHIKTTRSLERIVKPSPRIQARPKMVDASTQYSPPAQRQAEETPTGTIAGLHLSEDGDHPPKTVSASEPAKQTYHSAVSYQPGLESPSVKRQAGEEANATATQVNGTSEGRAEPESPTKKARPDAPVVRMMPQRYETCNTRDLVVLIASMLMELIRYNDAIPLKEGQLTRFHSRAPPGISVLDYLQRLATHATLSPPILLSVVYYIDRLCALYPAFTISSLTVHRFLITSSTVASKGLSDSFWTNKVYARVGGVSMKELALLELEFLTRMDWKIVPKAEVLVDYYRSLIGRNSQYQLEDVG